MKIIIKIILNYDCEEIIAVRTMKTERREDTACESERTKKKERKKNIK